MRAFLILMSLAMPAAAQDGSWGDPETVWQLASIDGQPFAGKATLSFRDDRITGQAPCNGYSADLVAAYPAFAVGPVMATRMACPELAGEAEFFDRLEAMTTAEMSQGALTLSDGTGAAMVFQPAD